MPNNYSASVGRQGDVMPQIFGLVLVCLDFMTDTRHSGLVLIKS